MKIVSLTVKQIKGIEAVHIEPDLNGHMVVISGKNGAGKSTAIDSIAYTLGGKDLICNEPIRRGAHKGSTEVVLDNGLRVQRFYTPGGGRLVVTPKDSGPLSKPQTFLSALVGPISFDPLAFSRMSPKDQRETLAKLIGLDTTDLDRERMAVYDARTEENREMRRLEGVLSEVERDESAPTELVDVSALVADLRSADAQHAEAERLASCTEALKRDITFEEESAAGAISEAEDLQRQIAALLKKAEEARERAADSLAAAQDMAEKATAAKAALPDREAIKTRIESAEGINEKVRANQKFTAHAAAVAQRKAEVDRLTGKLNDIDAQKLQRIADAKYPIEGLALDEDYVLYQDLPLSQASQAEELRISVAIGIAMNPDLRLLLIRDGDHLDDESLCLVAKMAEESDSQLWVERIREDAATSVVIEAGRVKGAAVEDADEVAE